MASALSFGVTFSLFVVIVVVVGNVEAAEAVRAKRSLQGASQEAEGDETSDDLMMLSFDTIVSF